jgi:hypothetical protein
LAVDEEVGRLQVAVDNALLGRGRHPLTRVLHPGHHLLLREWPTASANPVVEIGSLHPLHDEYGAALGQDVEIMYGDNVRRPDSSQQLCFTEKTFRRGIRPNDLDGYKHVETLMTSPVDDSHAATPHLPEQFITCQKGGVGGNFMLGLRVRLRVRLGGVHATSTG